MSGMSWTGGLGLVGAHPSPLASQGGQGLSRQSPGAWGLWDRVARPVWPGLGPYGAVCGAAGAWHLHTHPSTLRAPCGLAGVRPFPLFCDTLQDAGPRGPLRPRMSPGLSRGAGVRASGLSFCSHGAPSTALRPRAESRAGAAGASRMAAWTCGLTPRPLGPSALPRGYGGLPGAP